MYVNHRQRDAVTVPPVPVALHLWTPVPNEAHVIAGATHVDAHDVAESGRGGGPSGGNYSAGRSRADRGEGSTTDFGRRRDSSRARRKEALPGEASRRKPLLQPVEVSHNGRADEGVHQSGRDPLELRWLRIDLVGKRDELDRRVFIENDLSRASLMFRIQVRMEEHHRDGRDTEGPQPDRRLAD